MRSVAATTHGRSSLTLKQILSGGPPLDDMILDDIGGMLGKKQLLHIVSWVSAGFALILLFAAISLDSWLFTVEREPSDKSNGSYLITLHSGLWRVCKKQTFMEGVSKNTQWNTSWLAHDYHSINCSRIPYFEPRKKDSGELKPTESILLDMRPAAVFPLSALVVLCIGGVLTVMGRCDHRTQKLVFIGGGASIVSGILTLIGIVLYVGSVSQAFDAITGPITIETKYVYFYGAALRLCIVAFVLSEFSGVFAIYLFIAQRRHQIQVQSLCPQLPNNKSMSTLQNHRDYKVGDCLLSTTTSTTNAGDLSYFANSISTIGFSPSQVVVTATSFPQVSLFENAVSVEARANSISVAAAPYSRSSSQKTLSGQPYSCRRVPESKSPDLNHTAGGDPIRVKVVPHKTTNKGSRGELNVTQSVQSLNVISLPSSPSQSLSCSASSSSSSSASSPPSKPPPISQSPMCKSTRRIPLSRRKVVPVNCSTSSLRWVDEGGRRPTGARSAISINSQPARGEDTVQAPQRKKPRPNVETVSRTSCRDCELLKYRQRPNRAAPPSTTITSIARPRLSGTIVLTASEAETSSGSTSRCDDPSFESPNLDVEYSYDEKSSSRCETDRKCYFDQSSTHGFQVPASRSKPKSRHHSSLEVSSSLLTVQKSSDEKPDGGSISRSNSSACSRADAQQVSAQSTSNSEWYLKSFIAPISAIGPSPDSETCQCVVNAPKLPPWESERKHSTCTVSGGSQTFETRPPPSLPPHRSSYAPLTFLQSTRLPSGHTSQSRRGGAPTTDSSKSSEKHYQKITPV